jgi:hypothetical protein
MLALMGVAWQPVATAAVYQSPFGSVLGLKCIMQRVHHPVAAGVRLFGLGKASEVKGLVLGQYIRAQQVT